MSGCKTVIKKVKDVAEATTLVADWFERENKPATPQSLTDALGSRVAKPLVQKILDQLHTDNKLCVKDLKKIRFYYLNMQGGLASEKSNEGGATASPLSCDSAAQTGEPLVVDNQEEAAADDATALHDVGLAAASLAENHRRLARWRQWPSRADRVAQRAALEEEVRQLQADINTLRQRRGAEEDRSSSHSSTESRVARVRRVVRRYRRARQLWTERKRWAMRLLEVTGGDMHSPQQIAVLLGCTTDADAGVSFESAALAIPPQLLREIGLT